VQIANIRVNFLTIAGADMFLKSALAKLFVLMCVIRGQV